MLSSLTAAKKSFANTLMIILHKYSFSPLLVDAFAIIFHWNEEHFFSNPEYIHFNFWAIMQSTISSVARKFKSICRKLALFEFALPSSTCKLAS